MILIGTSGIFLAIQSRTGLVQHSTWDGAVRHMVWHYQMAYHKIFSPFMNESKIVSYRIPVPRSSRQIYSTFARAKLEVWKPCIHKRTENTHSLLAHKEV